MYSPKLEAKLANYRIRLLMLLCMLKRTQPSAGMLLYAWQTKGREVEFVSRVEHFIRIKQAKKQGKPAQKCFDHSLGVTVWYLPFNRHDIERINRRAFAQATFALNSKVVPIDAHVL